MYQGHLADGSGIQKHSAGGLYPFVVFAKASNSVISYGVLSPDGTKAICGTCDAAIAHAERLLEARSRPHSTLTPEPQRFGCNLPRRSARRGSQLTA
jgi:hypothetical protein